MTVCHLNRPDKSKPERRAVDWSMRDVDSLVKWKKMAFILLTTV